MEMLDNYMAFSTFIACLLAFSLFMQILNIRANIDQLLGCIKILSAYFITTKEKPFMNQLHCTNSRSYGTYR